MFVLLNLNQSLENLFSNEIIVRENTNFYLIIKEEAQINSLIV